jgi:hypothetical protein
VRTAPRPSNVRARLLGGGLLIAMLALWWMDSVHASPVTITGIAGTFSSPDKTGNVITAVGPDPFFDNTATAQFQFEAGGLVLRWGNLDGAPGFGTSAVGFLGAGPPASPVAEGEEFLLGLLLFANGSSELDTLIFGADLTINVAGTDEQGNPVDPLLLGIGIGTTLNRAGPGWGAFNADFITLTGLGPQVSLHANEGALVIANLFAKIVGDPVVEVIRLELPPGQEDNGFIGDGEAAPAPIPEPASLALMGVGLLGLGLARRRPA